MKKAFTLIELLAVIAIISLLAAILLAVLSSAREKARETPVHVKSASVRHTFRPLCRRLLF